MGSLGILISFSEVQVSFKESQEMFLESPLMFVDSYEEVVSANPNTLKQIAFDFKYLTKFSVTFDYV